MPMPVPANTETAAQSNAGSSPSKTAKSVIASNPFEKMTISSSTFVPKNIQSSEQPIQGDGSAGNTAGQDLNRGHANSVDPFEDFGGYSNPYSATIDIEKEKRKQQELEE